MNKTCYLTTLIVLCCIQLSYGQRDTISSCLYSSSGINSELTSYQVSYSVGELAVNTFTSTGYYLTEGFQQGEYSTYHSTDSTYHIEVNPNPVQQNLYIDFFINDERNYRVEIISMNGSKIYSYNYTALTYGQRVTLDLSLVSRGLYFVNIYSLDGQVFKTYKILRI